MSAAEAARWRQQFVQLEEQHDAIQKRADKLEAALRLTRTLSDHELNCREPKCPTCFDLTALVVKTRCEALEGEDE